MMNCKHFETPIIMNHGLQMIKGAHLERTETSPILSHTRPDSAYAKGIVSIFIHNPQILHMEATIRILIYLEGTVGRVIFFRCNNHLDLCAYTDLDWPRNKDNTPSNSFYLSHFLIG